MRLALSFDDISLVPQYSDLSSRADVDLCSDLFGYDMRLPILSSPMDTVTGIEMQKALLENGLLGIHHRYCDDKTWLDAANNGPIAVSPSINLDTVKQACCCYLNLPIFVIDVAHGDSRACFDLVANLLGYGFVISGNICTAEAAKRYLDIGVNTLRVGVSVGSVCSTRVVAGVGIPNVTAIMDIRNACPTATILADGGLRSSGDIVKALAAGADFVMLGRLLAGAKEAPGKRRLLFDEKTKEFSHEQRQKEYRGMASQEALDTAGKERNVEGISTWIPEEGTVAEILDKLERGIRAGFSYCGARNIQELHQKAEFVQVTHNGYVEGLPKL